MDSSVEYLLFSNLAPGGFNLCTEEREKKEKTMKQLLWNSFMLFKLKSDLHFFYVY